jgi:cytochrome c oxidase assembly factor 2
MRLIPSIIPHRHLNSSSCCPQCQIDRHQYVTSGPILTDVLLILFRRPVPAPPFSAGDEFIMPPHLHPRSRLTSSLFATTLLASFLVVGVPHILPCPAPRVAYADGEMAADGTIKRRRRRKSVNPEDLAKEGPNEVNQLDVASLDGADSIEEQTSGKRSRRECPIPKPSGRVGELLGFKNERSAGGNGTTSTRSP